MLNRWAATMFVVALCAVGPTVAGAQTRPPVAGGLKRNLPNPFNPITRITFQIGDVPCADPNQQFVVSLHVINVLQQVIAIPTLERPSAGTASTSGVGKPIDKMRLTCGEYTAYWNGKDMHTGREVASGIYKALLYIDGKLGPPLAMQVIK
jgi:hypothetical protein